MSSLSCLALLPESDRERIGFKDPANPIVLVDFRVEERQLSCFSTSTVGEGTVLHWLKSLPPEALSIIEGRRLQLRVDSASATVLENGQLVTDRSLQLFADQMFELMRQRHGLMTEVVAHLPKLEDLRRDLDTFVRTSISLALADGSECLSGAAWLVVPGCDHCSPGGRDYAENARDTYGRTVAMFAELDQKPDIFLAPAYAPGACKDASAVRDNAVSFLTDVTRILLQEIVPAAYAELAPQHEAGEVIDPRDMIGIDLTVIALRG
jgi:hypothetical protein